MNKGTSVHFPVLISSKNYGLEASPVHRLRKLWEVRSLVSAAGVEHATHSVVVQQLPSKYRSYYDSLADLFRADSRSRMRFRTILQEAIPPCVPQIGLFLSDLTFIDVRTSRARSSCIALN